MVVEEQSEPQQPSGAQARMMRQNEAQGADDVGRDLPEDFALDQRFADQTKLVIFEIAQAAMHQLGRPGRRPARQIIHFAEKNGVAPPRRIARDAAAIDAAPNDGEVEDSVQRTFPQTIAFALAISLSILNKSQPNTKASEKGNRTTGRTLKFDQGGATPPPCRACRLARLALSLWGGSG